jgi:hypothetical protein
MDIPYKRTAEAWVDTQKGEPIGMTLTGRSELSAMFYLKRF